jgi:S-adenosylhomocysteine hydrolase
MDGMFITLEEQTLINLLNGTGGSAGLLSGRFTNRVLSNGDLGINSDYYAYLEAIWTFKTRG